MTVQAVLDQSAAVARWVAQQPPFDGSRDFGNCQAIGWTEDGQLIAGTVYNNWDPDAGVIEMSSASTSPRWLSRNTLRVMFAYPFQLLGCQMVVLRVSEHNDRMISIAERFGFVGHRIPRLRGPDEDEIIFTLTVEDWQEKSYARSIR